MGSNKENSTTVSSNDKEVPQRDANHREVKKVVKIVIACFVSFIVSLAGGLTLAWWQFEYHPENEQLWMVPFGLILLATPVIVWVSLVFSDICTLKTNKDIERATAQPLPLPDDSTPDPER
ncbi:hypothetical protein TorRG33x02_242310 [Trema orientale]|uniref:Transmembrane protein n=1 Tax=Trema orientale TaxID=63057 RepID=A0A2P5DTB8_TREOI|nr:hypothetical protein TorRG33x02_242310 [Trema orientale]